MMTRRRRSSSSPSPSSSSSSSSSSGYVPPELWAQILARLPVKTLLILRCVSRSLRSIIDCPHFASMHLDLYKAHPEGNHLLVMKSLWSPTVYAWDSLEETAIDINHMKKPLSELRSHQLELLGQINGLLLVRAYQETSSAEISCIWSRFQFDELMLWNPSIRKTLKLPALQPDDQPHLELPCHRCLQIGLGFHRSSNEYKVLVFQHHVPCDDRDHSIAAASVHVFLLSEGCWRSFRVDDSPSLWAVGASVSVNGAIHWLGFDNFCPPFIETTTAQVVSFDVGNELIAYRELPIDVNKLKKSKYDFMHLVVMGESLAFCYVLWDSTSIWLLDGSFAWTRAYTINPPTGTFFSRDIDLFVRKDGKMLFMDFYPFDSKFPRLILYDCESQHFKYVGKQKELSIDTFVESLALLSEARRAI